jgi:hypothetical protein
VVLLFSVLCISSSVENSNTKVSEKECFRLLVKKGVVQCLIQGFHYMTLRKLIVSTELIQTCSLLQASSQGHNLKPSYISLTDPTV